MTLEEQMQARIRAARDRFPSLWAALEQTLTGQEEGTRRCLLALWAGLDGRDLLCLPPELLLRYAQASRQARERLPWGRQVPEELFVRYVLPPRVNNEFPDGSRPVLFQQLAERVKELSMTEAALEVNVWCCEQAAYTPTDDRTIAPLGMLRRGRGRCGEESTLLVSALRAVGIPARQCYAPWWAHCDDNHAWVEFWADGAWHYTGACEPEPRPDTGWFTSAASRAMLVRSFAPDLEKGGYELVNTTGRYAPTVPLTARAQRDGAPCPSVPVRVQLVNYAQLSTLWEGLTDRDGRISLEVGRGCLILSAFWDGRLVERRVDVRASQTVVLRWEEGVDPLVREDAVRWELTPPAEQLPPIPPEDPAHARRLKQCDALRREKQGRISRETSPLLRRAGENAGEIAAFLALPDFDAADKELLLSTLTEKDFGDVTCAALADALSAALPWKDRVPLPLWRDEILAPRVEWEPFLPIRQSLRALLVGAGLESGRAVLDWMDAHLRPLEEHGRTDRRGNAAQYVRHGFCPASEWDLTAVELCRTLGIPARLDPVTGAFSPEGPADTVTLTLRPGEAGLRYREHFTLARWDGETYRTLELGTLTLDGDTPLALAPGPYRLLTARRQIDGTVSARAACFTLREDRTLAVELEPDQTGALLRHVSLPVVNVVSLTDGAVQPLPRSTRRGSLLLFLQPGAEPTEHLLRELLELGEEIRRGGWPVWLLLSRREEGENDTLGQVLSALPGSQCLLSPREDRLAVQRSMGLGDARLPLAVAVDRAGRGLYACANYQIGLGERLVRALALGDSF